MSTTRKLPLHKYASVPGFRDKDMKENDKRSVPRRHKEHTAGNASGSAKHGNELFCISFKILKSLPNTASVILFTHSWHSKVLIHCLNFSVLKFAKMNICISTSLRHTIFLMETLKKTQMFQNTSKNSFCHFQAYKNKIMRITCCLEEKYSQ